jgi:hypothetical protein
MRALRVIKRNNILMWYFYNAKYSKPFMNPNVQFMDLQLRFVK